MCRMFGSPAVAVHLDAVVDGVAVGRLAGGQQHGGDDAGARRGYHAVGLDQVEAQRVGHERRRVVLLDDREHVAADQPRGEGELLHGCEVIDAGRVARPFIVGPQVELALGLCLPCVCGLLCHAERLPVDPALELEPDADHVGAVSADGRGGDWRGHVEHPGSLSERPVVGVDVLLGAAAEGPEALGRPLVPARAGVAVALVLRVRSLAHVLLLFAKFRMSAAPSQARPWYFDANIARAAGTL